MDTLIQNGIDWIVAIQSLGNWLELPMKFFTFLGYENFFFLVLPLVYWSLDAALGLRIALILATSNYLNAIVKLWFASPRPYWVSANVKSLSAESSFGIPSGHAQNAAALWGVMAGWVATGRRWIWLAAGALIFFIGFSRLYLGVHFVQDVLLGWSMGVLMLFAFLKLWDPIAAWIKTKTLLQQILIPFCVSLVMIIVGLLSHAPLAEYVFPLAWTENALRAGSLPNPASIEGIFTASGSFFGLAAGAAWIAARGGYQASGSVEKRALRYVIGLIGIIIFWNGLGQIFPRGETLLPVILRFIRYSLVGFWVTAGAPWLFFHFKIARYAKM